MIRHSLNLESGLNDGLALPAVLAFTAAAAASEGFVWWEFVLQDIGVGLATGLVVAFVASRLMPRERRAAGDQRSPEGALRARRGLRRLRGCGAAPRGQRFHRRSSSAAIALGIWRPDIRACFEARSEDLIEVVKLGVFLVFGAILTFEFLFEDGLGGGR